MKRFLYTLAILAFAAALIPAVCQAQARINTKKLKIADLPTRTTKVVLTGNDMTDMVFRNEVSARWRLSPYEFCTVDEYNKLKNDTGYYFLLIAGSNEAKYEGIKTLTLLKGGKYDSEDPRQRPIDVASLPFCSAAFPSGREMVILPALLDILQDYVSEAMESDRDGYRGFDIYAGKIRKARIKRAVFAESDLIPGLSPAFSKKYFDDDMMVVSDSEADKAFTQKSYNTLVSFVVAPFDPSKGSPCYKMLIDADTHELYYFKHHRISEKNWAGFLPRDLKSISSHL